MLRHRRVGLDGLSVLARLSQCSRSSMPPYATSLCRLQLLVYAALRYAGLTLCGLNLQTCGL